MQTVDDFMREFFSNRIAEEERELISRAPFRRKYYDDDCEVDSRSQILAILKSEKIVSVKTEDSQAIVITVNKDPFFKHGDQMHRRRYHLKWVCERWLIAYVETECLLCHGQGNETCLYCKGKHWQRGGLTADERGKIRDGNQ